MLLYTVKDPFMHALNFQFIFNFDIWSAIAQKVHLISVQLLQCSRGYQLVQKPAVVHPQMMILQ